MGTRRRWWWYAGRGLGVAWTLPVTALVWIVYILPVWLVLRDIRFRGWAEFGVAEFTLAKDGLEPWYARAWRDWAGWGGPSVFICRRTGDLDFDARTRVHELEHCSQQFWLGPLFYPVYLIVSVFIWALIPDRSAYLHNPFERWARAAACQTVDVPPEHWLRYPGQRWPWW